MRKTIVPAVLLVLCLSVPASAGIAVNVNIGLPRLILRTPPALIVIPGTYIYMAPDIDADLVFYQGYWYRPYKDRWYRSADYNGNWIAVPMRAVPAPIRGLPPNWKRVPPGHERIPYGHVKKNWRTWERERHWERAEHRGSRRDVRTKRRSPRGRRDRYEEHRDKRGQRRYENERDRRDRRDKRRNGDDGDGDSYGGYGHQR